MYRLCRWISAVTLATLLLFALVASINQPLHAAQKENGKELVTIPFTLTAHNNIVVSALINKKDAVQLMLHTAVNDVTLTEDATRKSKSLKFIGKNQVKSWGGTTAARFSKGNTIQIGSLRRGAVDIWEDKLSGEDTDGKFGLDFFGKRIVEIDFDQRRLVLHENLPRKVEKYKRLKMESQNGELLIEGSCIIDGKPYTHKFLLHSGYSGGILLDDAFAAQAGIDGKIPITDESRLKDSFGNIILVKKGVLPVFGLGDAKLSHVPVGFFAGAIGTQKRSIIGSEVLMQFNIVFDTAHNAVYLSRRHPYNSEITTYGNR